MAPTLAQRLVVDAVRRLPQGAISRLWGALARCERPRGAVALFMRTFAAGVGMDMAEAEAPMAAYPTLEALFVRRLRPGSRPLDPRPGALLCPVDGTMGISGTIAAGQALQVKGRSYSVAALLDDAGAAARFAGGSFATVYLAPKNYHRVHAPCAGEVAAGRLVPGGLLPVFPAAVAQVDGLFARNERLIAYLDGAPAGVASRLAVVMVGATLVGRMSFAFDPTVATNVRGARARALHYAPPRPLARGGELGTFALGSTVVLLGEPGRLQLAPPPPGTPVRVGEALGHFVPPSAAG